MVYPKPDLYLSHSDKNLTPLTPMLVSEDEVEMRLDRWFKRHFPGLNHGQLEKLLRGGQIRVDGKRALANLRLNAGQAIRIPPRLGLNLAGARQNQPQGQEEKFNPTYLGREQANLLKDLLKRIIFIDDWVIALDKPAGLAVQGGTGTPHHIDGLLDHFRFGMPERPRLVHRLDRETSGVLLLARTRRAAVILSKTWQMRHSEKIYWAIVAGVPKREQGEIADPVAAKEQNTTPGTTPGASPGTNPATNPGKKSQLAVTHYRVMDAAAQHAAWLELRPVTGRTHQLRLHCLALHCPILADSRYGGAASILPGLDHDRMLHLFAHSLRLPHPSGQGEIFVRATVPPHMAATAKALGFALKDRPHHGG
ncbi:MAG: RluA family pseudouridine synthase [Candidatus Symbiobacter sp.]|nr:RluA family pseudouridine synthase [Candidatus Symbiobacter sp.]